MTFYAQQAALDASEMVGYFPSTCDVESSTDDTNSVGEVTQEWTAYIEGAACRFQPAGDASREIRRSDGTVAVAAYYCVFRDLWPDIETKDRIVGDGRIWNILGITHDASKTHTRAIIERAS